MRRNIEHAVLSALALMLLVAGGIVHAAPVLMSVE